MLIYHYLQKTQEVLEIVCVSDYENDIIVLDFWQTQIETSRYMPLFGINYILVKQFSKISKEIMIRILSMYGVCMYDLV